MLEFKGCLNFKDSQILGIRGKNMSLSNLAFKEYSKPNIA